MSTKNRTVASTLTTSNQDIFVAPNQFAAAVLSIFITNTTSSAKTVSIDWYDASEDSYHTLFEQAPIIANGVVQLTETLWLDSTDKIRALASANSAIEVSIQVAEQFRN
jgi:hypothetical protein